MSGASLLEDGAGYLDDDMDLVARWRTWWQDCADGDARSRLFLRHLGEESKA